MFDEVTDPAPAVQGPLPADGAAHRIDGFSPSGTDEVARLTGELAEAREKIGHLETALLTSREIGIAIGILMHRHRITATAAFELMVTASQHTHRKIRDLAAEIAYTGVLPRVQPRPGGPRIGSDREERGRP